MVPKAISMNEYEILRNNTACQYLGMINDKWRNQFFYDALNKHAAGKVVLDMGSGTGILSFYALAAGAKFVYAVESNPDSANLTYQVLKQKFDTKRFAVLTCNFWTDELDSERLEYPIDILVTETIGPGLFDQGMIHTWECIKPYLSPDAISIPDSISCDLWVWQGQFDSPYMRSVGYEADQNNKLLVDACINQDYVEALLSQNRPVSAQQMQWVNINSIRFRPHHIYTDKVIYTMNSLPAINFSDDLFPGHMKPDISFEFEIDGPAFVAIIGKLSFESKTLYIKDALLMPWRYNPVFNIPSSGKYRINYNNFNLTCMNAEEWKLSKTAYIKETDKVKANG